MSAKHTPGPWTVLMAPAGARIESEYASVVLVGCDEIGADDVERLSHEAKANARLIAAAPELLEALKEAERLLAKAFGEPPALASYTNDGHRAIRDARAAIAKAEGES